MVVSMELITFMISLFSCWSPSMVEAVWKLFAFIFSCLFHWFGGLFTNDWLFLDESYFKFSSSSGRYLNCLFYLSSSVWFIDKLDRDGGFPWLLLMLSVFSCSIVVFCWVFVEILVLLDCLSMMVLFRLHFTLPECKVSPVFSCYTFSCIIRVKLVF